MNGSKDSFWFWGGGIAVLVVVAGIGLYAYQRDRGQAEVTPAALPSAPAAADGNTSGTTDPGARADHARDAAAGSR